MRLGEESKGGGVGFLGRCSIRVLGGKSLEKVYTTQFRAIFKTIYNHKTSKQGRFNALQLVSCLLVDGEREAKEIVDHVWVAVYLLVNHNC